MGPATMHWDTISGGVTTAAMKKMITMATPRTCLRSCGVDNAHLGQDDGDQRHFKHTAKDDEHGQAEVDVALDAGGGLDVLGTLDARAEEPQHEGHHELVGEQHAHAEQMPGPAA